ncbi:MAG: InlB B-repeat-containing protein, partial [Spirochaetales bacterium]|nr:InlB B-repeat-containing protein [Spirochaetales bacterium]
MSCRVCFRSEGRTVSETMFTAGRKIIIPNSPSRPGFEFSGWWVADGGSIREFSRQWLEDRKASEDVVVDARWKNVSYRLEVQEFNTDGYVQDGAISSDLFFKFHSDGSAVVHSMKDHRELGRFILDKADIFKPHCNATCFSAIRFRSEDEFPLLYANIYNSYAKEQDRKLGYFGAYRLFRDGDSFSSELVQVLRIGFTAENGLWHSEDGNDRSPYGNFIVDTDRNEMWAFVTRDLPHSTRFFSFRLPDADEGVFSEDYGVKVFTFGKEDSLRMFDIPYSYYL